MASRKSVKKFPQKVWLYWETCGDDDPCLCIATRPEGLATAGEAIRVAEYELVAECDVKTNVSVVKVGAK